MTTAPEPTHEGRAALRRTRTVLVWVVLVVVGGALLALAAGTSASGTYLDPTGTGQGGTRALVEVLREQGIDVQVVGTAEDAIDATTGDDTTVVVGNTDLWTTAAATRMLRGTAGAHRVVLLDGAAPVIGGLDLGVDLTYPLEDPVSPQCDEPWVRPDDRVSRVSWSIVPSGERMPARASTCYPFPTNADADPDMPQGYAAVTLARTPGHAPVTVVGFPDAATNRFVTESEHAGLMVRLLGESPRLVWYQPDAADLTANPATEDEGSVWPDWTVPGLVVVGLAFVVFAIAQGRRLGRLVPEPLPVLVRASETTESRAELYRAAGDRTRAAAVLRAATRERLGRRLGLPPRAPHEAVVLAVADATGVPTLEVDALLRDAPPLDEASLVTLAQQLADLEEKVTRHD